jgi:hypothetical protein
MGVGALLLPTVMVAAMVAAILTVNTCPPQLQCRWQRPRHLMLHTPHPQWLHLQWPHPHTALAPRIGTTTVVITAVCNVSALFAHLVVVPDIA